MTAPHEHLAGSDPGDGDITARLLRLAGARDAVPPERADRVRQAVLAECRVEAARRRTVRRMTMVAASLALAATAVVAVRWWTSTHPPAEGPGAVIATVVRMDGGPRLRPAQQDGESRALTASTSIHAGDRVETTREARLGLRLAGGASIRFDVGSRARLLSARVIELTAGAVYVDTARAGTGLEIRSELGTVRDVGTQFEVRVQASSLRVRVRSGAVSLERGSREVLGRPGNELLVTRDHVSIRNVAVYGPDWAWTVMLTLAVPIESRRLADVLENLCREHGWRLRYEEPALAADASRAILHGSVEGLSPEQALDVVFAAGGLGHRLQDGEVLVTRTEPRVVP